MTARIPSRHRWKVAAVVAVPILLVAPWTIIRSQTFNAVHPAASDFRHADAALVLGARVYEDGRPSRFLRERVEIGVRLYQAGVVDYIIMSGDGTDSSGFGEPTVMRRVAEEMGVPPEAIVEDPLGLDTYSSCKRARDEFGVGSMIIATQEFHVPRAVWICDRLGIDAQGAYPPPRPTKSTIYGNAREVAATAKAMLDVARGREPAG
jgi:vancomycin permeability regulator SanA